MYQLYTGVEQEIRRLWQRLWRKGSARQGRKLLCWKYLLQIRKDWHPETHLPGLPSMGAEQLEETEMEPFVEVLEPLVSGKSLLLFGSYGWGDGEWMRDWAERMKNAGAVLIREEGIIANEAPDDEALEECRSAGQELAAKV